MQDKESQLHIFESRFKNDNEQAATAVIPSQSTPEKLEDLCGGVYDNSHHSDVRRSSDDREEDLLLEELYFDESWYSVSQEERLDQAWPSFEGRDDLPSSVGASTDHDELKKSKTPSTSGLIFSSTLIPLPNQSDGIYNSHFARFADGQEGHRLDQPASLEGHEGLPSSSGTSTDHFEGRDDLPSSVGASTDHDELKRSITPSTRSLIPSSPTPIALRTQFNGVDNNVQHFRYSDGEEGRLDQPAGVAGQDGLSTASVISTDKIEQIAMALEKESLQRTSAPQQEGCCYVRDSLVSGIVKKEAKSPTGGCVDDGSFPDNTQPTLYIICLFKRRIIARDELEHALFIIPFDQFNEIFPKIKKDEALVYHGTEFPMVEEHSTIGKCLLHRHFEIAGNLKVSFEVIDGQNFSIVDPCMRTVTVSEIRLKSTERIVAGFSVEIFTRCTGGKDTLYEDSIRVMLQSESSHLHLIFPIAYYEASMSPWLHDTPVTSMPKEDRDALRSCHVALLDNIGDAMSICEHLYQHKILDSSDLEEIRDITKKRDRNAYLLFTIQTRGNILDFVIKLMQAQRENQGAAAILQKRRHHGPDM